MVSVASVSKVGPESTVQYLYAGPTVFMVLVSIQIFVFAKMAGKERYVI